LNTSRATAAESPRAADRPEVGTGPENVTAGAETSVAYHEAGHALVAESREHADLAALLKSTEA
jgi:ATP-dependent Zn protease